MTTHVSRSFANPNPLGLCAFALTTFLLSLINLNTRGVSAVNLVVAVAYGYGGLCQLLAGMWAMAVGDTFSATVFSSLGGFWISFAIIMTPGGFQIIDSLALFITFLALDLTFLVLGIGYLIRENGVPTAALTKAGGVLGLLAAFSAWYNAVASLLDRSNSFFVLPLGQFPWKSDVET